MCHQETTGAPSTWVSGLDDVEQETGEVVGRDLAADAGRLLTGLTAALEQRIGVGHADALVAALDVAWGEPPQPSELRASGPRTPTAP